MYSSGKGGETASLQKKAPLFRICIYDWREFAPAGGNKVRFRLPEGKWEVQTADKKEGDPFRREAL